MLNDPLPPDHDPHFIIFDQIDREVIRRTALRTHSAAGPSGVDAASWKRFCSSFRSSSDLCYPLALLACQLCTSYVNPDGLSGFVACRLIALDKCPGVRPIGIGEACRRIIAKTILNVIGPDVMEAAGPLQLCAGQDAGCEAAVHSIHQLYLEYDTEALLLVDAENAFNSLNRETALRNILHLCPSIGHVVFNTYHDNVSLFIGGETIYSLEGTTQGDPLAMAMYALGVTPLIQQMGHINSTRQIWYVDDSTTCGSVEGLLSWWNALIDIGPLDTIQTLSNHHGF